MATELATEAIPAPASSRARRRMLAPFPTHPEHEVTIFELLFDLLVAFAFSQIDTLVVADPTWTGLLRGVLILIMLWGCWLTFSLAANTVHADQGLVRNAHFLAIVGMILMGLALPRAFLAHGLSPRIIIVAGSYLVIRAASAVILRIVAGPRASGRCLMILTAATGSACLLTASTLTPGSGHVVLWVSALGCEAVAFWTFARGWHVVSAGHLSDRFGFIIIFCLDMSLGGLVYSMLRDPVTYAKLGLVCLVLISGAVIWWLYFGSLADRAQHNMDEAVTSGHLGESDRLLRQHYILLHCLALAGMILYTTGLRAVGRDLFAPGAGSLGVALHPFWTFCLAGGLAAYIAAIAAMWRVQHGRVPRAQLAVAASIVVLVPLIEHDRALLVIILLVGLVLAMVIADLCQVRKTI